VKPIPINTILYTRDGQRIGNAIVTDFRDGAYAIMTDYGNEAVLAEPELRAWFTFGPVNPDHKHARRL